MSLTTAWRGSRSRASSSGGAPSMPRTVVLTRRLAPSSAASRSAQGKTRIGPKISAATRSKDDGGTRLGSPARRAGPEILEKPKGIGVVADKHAVADDKGIHRTDAAGRRGYAVHDCECRLLVGQGNIDAGKAKERQGADRSL